MHFQSKKFILLKQINGLYCSKSGLNYSFIFPFERNFFNDEFVEYKDKWMEENWYITIIFAIVYIILVHLGQYWMRNRERYELRSLLTIWNLILAAFSIIGTIRVWPEFFYTIGEYGLQESICNNTFKHGVTGFWSWIFTVSKLFELFDTAFVILRKQKLVFLHWYHHASVLVYTWYVSIEMISIGRWFMFMNFVVHSFMYSYYALRALKFKVPKFVSISITTAQLIQMFLGLSANFVALFAKSNGQPCHISDNALKISFALYASYFLLFIHFFYSSYLKKPEKPIKKE